MRSASSAEQCDVPELSICGWSFCLFELLFNLITRISVLSDEAYIAKQCASSEKEGQRQLPSFCASTCPAQLAEGERYDKSGECRHDA
jgi:hypothetical protein